MTDIAARFPATPWVIKPLVQDEVYTDRAEFLEYFYQAALNAATRRTMSTGLLGRRRMGKTEIFRRVVNRLFFEQDPGDPKAVVPVYYSFSDSVQDRWEFSLGYLENFIRYYLAFYAQQPEIITSNLPEERLLALLKSMKVGHPYPQSLERLHLWYDAMLRRKVTVPEKEALEIPRRVSDVNDSTIVVFLDEFQNTRLDQFGFDIVGWVKEAVESNTCPHFVTGSAMSILAREILGRGSLFGRFRSKPIESLSGYWGAMLVKRAAALYQATVSELMAPVVADRCGGNPFYIAAVVQQSVEIDTPLVDEETINSVLAVDITSGFIWAELYEQVNGWIERVNEHGITKWILYLSALEEEPRISLERIQRELKAKEGQDVALETIREVLIRLSRGDLLEYRELGGWFHKVDDPILVEFLKVWGRVDVEGQNPERVRSELDDDYRKQERRIHEYKGYLAEVFMAQVLLSNQDHRKQPLPGGFFNSDEDIELPRILHYLNHRVRLSSGKNREVDILAAYSGEKWVCQSKWVTAQRIGVAVLRDLMAQGAAVQAQYEASPVRLWLFAHEGLTQAAEELAQQEGILWSDRAQLDGLLTYLGLRPLPQL